MKLFKKKPKTKERRCPVCGCQEIYEPSFIPYTQVICADCGSVLDMTPIPPTPVIAKYKYKELVKKWINGSE